MTSWKIHNYEGYLAVALPFTPNWDEPVESKVIHVSQVPIAGYEQLIGASVEFADDRIGIVQCPGKSIVLDTEDWQCIVEERPVRKPRKGRGYDWKWIRGRWEKDWSS